MNIQVEELKPCKKRVKVEVPFSEMADDVASIKRTIQQKANIPGFRVGKAPINVIEKQYSDVIQNEIVNQVINNSYKKALEEKQLNPIQQVSVENVNYKHGESLSYQFDLEEAPVFDLPEYKGIPIKSKKLNVTEEHVEAEIKHLTERHASFNPANDRAIKMGDFVVVDYAIKQKEQVLDEAKQVWIEMREDFFIPKFCKNLIGMKKDESKQIKVVLPKEYAKQELAGKKVVMDLKVNEIKVKAVPELTEEFLKQLGDFTSIDDLKQKIRDELTAYFKQLQEKDMTAQIEDYFVKNTKIDVPDSVVDNYHNVLFEDTVSYLKNSGRANDEQIKEKEKDIKESTKKDAVNQVKLIYIFEAIAQKENIVVTDEELNNRIELLAKQSNKKVDEIRETLDKNNKMWDFKFKSRNEKLTKFLLDNAKIEEVEVKPEDNQSGKQIVK